MKNKRIIRIDASSLKRSNCARLIWLNNLEGYRTFEATNDMVYGSAFHKFAEEYYLTKGETYRAISAAKRLYTEKNPKIKKDREYLDISHLTITCSEFETVLAGDKFQPINGPDGQPIVELKFAIPYYADDEVEVLICGTIDKVGKFQNGVFGIEDYKTTTSWDKMKFLQSFKLDPQLRLYHWMLRWFAREFPQSIYAEICKDRVACMIHGVFLSKTKPTEFMRSSPFIFSEAEYQEFDEMLRVMVMKYVDYAKARNAPYVMFNGLPPREGVINGTCNTIYGGCPFYSACASPDVESFLSLVNNNYEKREYNPLNFG